MKTVAYPLAAGLVLALAPIACSSETTAARIPGTDARVTQMVGASGGTVTTPGGVKVDIPPGALQSDVQITVAPSTGPLPSEGTVVGPAFTFGPAGTLFSLPVTITLPVQLSALGSTPMAEVQVAGAPDGQTTFETFNAFAIDDSHVQALTQHFTTYVPVYIHDCGSGGPDSYTTCDVRCRSGYHQAQPAEGQCPSDLWGTALQLTCDKNIASGDTYQSCGEANCAYGYRVTFATNGYPCAISLTCTLIEGMEYDGCETSCASGYQDVGLSGNSCGYGSVGGVHCVSSSGASIMNVCTSAALTDGGVEDAAADAVLTPDAFIGDDAAGGFDAGADSSPAPVCVPPTTGLASCFVPSNLSCSGLGTGSCSCTVINPTLCGNCGFDYACGGGGDAGVGTTETCSYFGVAPNAAGGVDCQSRCASTASISNALSTYDPGPNVCSF
jgi:hypothetical protein